MQPYATARADHAADDRLEVAQNLHAHGALREHVHLRHEIPRRNERVLGLHVQRVHHGADVLDDALVQQRQRVLNSEHALRVARHHDFSLERRVAGAVHEVLVKDSRAVQVMLVVLHDLALQLHGQLPRLRPHLDLDDALLHARALHVKALHDLRHARDDETDGHGAKHLDDDGHEPLRHRRGRRLAVAHGHHRGRREVEAREVLRGVRVPAALRPVRVGVIAVFVVVEPAPRDAVPKTTNEVD
mmetsp:Transcript_23518/g.73780  ORF Transcript_23518/g.73780 Transcript_23518/m.73780 type:complete len:244 (-) Transcript_23518:759-1490(-)